MSVTPIELARVGKRYWQLHEQAMLLRSLVPGRRPRRTEHWALRGVDLRVEPGETVGILGHNGAGKTTLLRLLAGVSRPTEGRVRIAGRVAPLLSVGVGFHQEMSGRENVFVNGMLLGLTEQQVRRRFDDIVAFAELADFIDTPVKFYSSGMFMRLGFAVAVHVDADVLLIDEVLAVGDIAFQLKCFEHLRQLQARGATILLVSHSMHAIRLMCPRALLLDRGRVDFDGPAETAIARHHERLSERASASGTPTPGWGPQQEAVDVLGHQLVGYDGPTHHPEPGDWVTYRVRLRFNRAVDSPQFVFQVSSEDGLPCYGMQTTIGRSWRRFEAGSEADVEVLFRANLGGGTYRVTLTVTDRWARHVLRHDPAGTVMYLAPRLGSSGVVDLQASINAVGTDLTDHDDLLIGPRAAAT